MIIPSALLRTDLRNSTARTLFYEEETAFVILSGVFEVKNPCVHPQV
jgi:hypothetical protein